MNKVFILNPKAGKNTDIDKLSQNIKNTAENLGESVKIYITKCVGDAERFVREYCSRNGNARFIACGGDGTFGEVLNGAANFDGAEIGLVPMGTGNDFCRNFPHDIRFSDIKAQFFGKTVKCDAIKYKTCLNQAVTERYCANMFNIGFDCNAADLTAKMKTKPFISGSLAYMLSVLVTLVKKKGARLEIEIDGEKVHSGALLLTSIANGCFCGGGVKSNPAANVNDGVMDVNIVHNISRLNFLSKLPFYMKGTHVNLKGIEKIITAYRCKNVKVTPLDEHMRLCVDGEIYDAGQTEFEIVRDAFDFVLPSCECSRSGESDEAMSVK